MPKASPGSPGSSCPALPRSVGRNVHLGRQHTRATRHTIERNYTMTKATSSLRWPQNEVILLLSVKGAHASELRKYL